MKLKRVVIYKLCWDYRNGVYYSHATRVSLRSTKRLAVTLPDDLWVGKITRWKTTDVTRRVREK